MTSKRITTKNDETVKVVVRIRPMSSEEERNGNLVAAEAFSDRALISLKNPKAGDAEPPKDFYFDAVFGPNAEQKNIYDICASGVVESVLNGYNGTIFAYGQTGSGKTHTMEGKPDPPSLRGIIPNSFQHIFEYVSSSRDVQYLVRASYLEIYNEEIRDLLSKDPKNSLELKENIDSGVYVKDLTSFVVKNVAEIDHLLQVGKKNRAVAPTNMNATSSRSHAIFTVVVECGDSSGEHIRVGKLNLVDLAGSERPSKTGATGARLTEGIQINLSLIALGNVISALVDAKSTYIPYRASPLTRLLQNSLGGNAKTVMFANCGPADYNYAETLSTLRYANRAKNIKNKPKINEDPKDAALREYQEEIRALKAQLAATQRGVMIDESGREISMTNAKREIVEKIVEREVIKEVRVGASKEEMEEIRRKMEEEKEMLMKQAQNDMKALIEAQSRTAQERSELQQALDREAEDRRKVEDQQKALQSKLKAMEEKLIKGGEVMTKAQQQEQLLRKAEQELRDRKIQEAQLARELAEKDEQNLQLEEHFSSLQEEVEVKTKKLKKLWNKYQAAVRETKDLQQEFQTEKSDILDSFRDVAVSSKLKDLIIANFIPEDFVKRIEKRAVFNQEAESWAIPKMDLTGNALRADVTRPISNPRLRRPETEFSRQRKQFDNNPRYKYDNILSLDLDPAEKTTQEFQGPSMKSRVDMHLSMDINAFGDEIIFESLKYPYLSYEAAVKEAVSKHKSDRSDRRSEVARLKTASDAPRPKSASRRREEGYASTRNAANNVSDKLILKDNDVYPVARGLLNRK